MSRVPEQVKRTEPRARTAAPAQRAAGRGNAAASPRHGFAPVSPRHGFAAVSPRFGLAGGPQANPVAPADGLPEPLKTNMEAMSGLALDDVRVHRNSSKPAGLGALACAQGAEIHLGAAQEQHLPHEAWHIVQQKQGRVKAMLQLKGVVLNDDAALEQEADRMGAASLTAFGGVPRPIARSATTGVGVVQRVATPEEQAALVAHMVKKGIPANADNIHFYTTDENAEIGQLGRKRFQLVNTLPKQWRKIKDAPHPKGDFYGRLITTDTSRDEQIAGISHYSSGFSAIAQVGTLERYQMGVSSNTIRPANIVFTPGSSAGPRGDNALEMGRHFFGKRVHLSAGDYVLAAGADDFQWLHMRAHSLGGRETADNLFAGTSAANTQMNYVESALASLRDLGGLEADVLPIVDEGHRSKSGEVVERLNIRGNKLTEEDKDYMSRQDSRKLILLIYSVTVSEKEVWTTSIDPMLETGFDQSLFSDLRQAVETAIKGGNTGDLSAFNAAPGAPPPSSAAPRVSDFSAAASSPQAAFDPFQQSPFGLGTTSPSYAPPPAFYSASAPLSGFNPFASVTASSSSKSPASSAADMEDVAAADLLIYSYGNPSSPQQAHLPAPQLSIAAPQLAMAAPQLSATQPFSPVAPGDQWSRQNQAAGNANLAPAFGQHPFTPPTFYGSASAHSSAPVSIPQYPPVFHSTYPPLPWPSQVGPSTSSGSQGPPRGMQAPQPQTQQSMQPQHQLAFFQQERARLLRELEHELTGLYRLRASPLVLAPESSNRIVQLEALRLQLTQGT